MTERRTQPRSAVGLALGADTLPGEHPLLAVDDPLGLAVRPMVDDADLRQRIRSRLEAVGPFFKVDWDRLTDPIRRRPLH